MAWTFTCWSCGATKQMQTKVYRSHRCDGCGAAMLACKNCRFYDPYASKECKEPMSEQVFDKERANFCDYFEFGGENDEVDSAAEEARKKLENLFKK